MLGVSIVVEVEVEKTRIYISNHSTSYQNIPLGRVISLIRPK